MYGSDYPCWTPATALELFHEIGLSKEDQEKILNLNARRVLNLKDRGTGAGSAARIAAA
jgi:aminocarboxymuconate-semialdehyde decarboxylase